MRHTVKKTDQSGHRRISTCWITKVVVVAIATLLGASASADTGPAALASTTNSITFNWTAAGDDGSSGIAAQYDIRYSESPITEANWDQASQVDDEPVPAAAGSLESYTLNNLSDGTTYFVALKVADEVPNWSDISNVLTVEIPEDTVTLRIDNIQITNVTDTSAVVVWVSNEPATSQLYYGQTTALGLSTDLDTNHVAGGHSVLLTGLTPSTAYYVRVASRDVRDNEIQSPYYQFATNEPVAPAQPITDLVAEAGEDNGEIDLTWTVPGHYDSYIIGYSTEDIDITSWNAVTVYDGPAPIDSGDVQRFTMSDLELGELFYVAIVSVRHNGAMSPLSNVDTAVSKFSIIAGVDDEDSGLPIDFELAQNYPNPFNPSTTIEFAVPSSSRVRLTVYNTLGQVIEVLADENMSAGRHSVEWDGTGNGIRVASGVYLYRVEAGDFAETKKMVLTK